jgi:PhzF family phenazine biosynthesis protein
MRIPYFQVNAFTSHTFGGNPAGVCVLEEWLPDGLLQQIAAENNLSETAFLVRRDSIVDLRWMTPAVEVDLCGHATLASAFVLFQHLAYKESCIHFQTKSGRLTASLRGDLIELDFPSRPAAPSRVSEPMLNALGAEPLALLKARDYVAVFGSEAEVAALNPNMQLVSQLDCLGLIVTAPGKTADFVSRFFAPQVGVPEDPVTGSAHCSLIPYWAGRLGKTELFARQLSKRGGEIYCRDRGERVSIGGKAVMYNRGELNLANERIH